jgi:hypothetical protein
VDPTASHQTHDTASTGNAAADYSTCANPDAAQEPDLMDGPAPPGDRDTPLFQYSTDLTGGYDGGLTMFHRGDTCMSGYPSQQASDPPEVSKWAVHAWSTHHFAQPFTLRGLVTLSLFTITVGGVQAEEHLCASLIDRQTTGGVPADRLLGTGLYTLAKWPTDVRRLTFSFRLAQEEVVPADHELVLALQVRGDSGADISLLYDHPLYPSLLEVATTTPL